MWEAQVEPQVRKNYIEWATYYRGHIKFLNKQAWQDYSSANLIRQLFQLQT